MYRILWYVSINSDGTVYNNYTTETLFFSIFLIHNLYASLKWKLKIFSATQNKRCYLHTKFSHECKKKNLFFFYCRMIGTWVLIIIHNSLTWILNSFNQSVPRRIHMRCPCPRSSGTLPPKDRLSVNSRTKPANPLLCNKFGICVWCLHTNEMTPKHATLFTSNLKVKHDNIKHYR